MTDKNILSIVISFVLLQATLYALPEVIEGPVVYPANGHSYYLLQIGSWTESQEKAVQLGGNLATIDNQAENDWICTVFDSVLVGSGAKGFWIGINDADQEGHFVWAGGEPVTYVNWAPSEPSGEDFGHIWGSTAEGRQVCSWNDISNFRNDYPMLGVVEIAEEKVPILLEIIGPDVVLEQSENFFSIIVTYEDGTTRDVTWLSEWSVSSTAVASIKQPGLLETKDIDVPLDIVLTAEYASLGFTVHTKNTVRVETICRTGTALEFDGQDDYVAAGSIPPIEVSDPFTWSFWVRLSPNNSQYAVILGNQPDSTTNTHFFKFSPTYFEYVNFGYDGLIRYDIPVGLWVHLSIVKENNQLTYYSDGEIVGSDNVAKDMPENLLRLGGDPRLGSDFANCQIDEVSIWSIALTQQQIQENMYRRLLGSEPGLLGYWNFDEGNGQIARDLSNHDRNGLLGDNAEQQEDNDPIWVPSEAPVEGICDPLFDITRAIEHISQQKGDLLERLETVLSLEAAVMDSMANLIHDPNNGIPKQQLLQSRQKIFVATVREEHSQKNILDSLDQLDDALEILLGQDVAPSNAQDAFKNILRHRADINKDGVIDSIDFALLVQYWLMRSED